MKLLKCQTQNKKKIGEISCLLSNFHGKKTKLFDLDTG